MPAAAEKRGRCVSCKTIYVWLSKPRLCDAVCPKCSIRLERCWSLSAGTRLYQTPQVST